MRTVEPFERAWLRVGALLCAVGWGANHFVPLLLVYRARLTLDAASLALLFGMYALGLVPGLLVAGPLSDRLGRRAVVLPSACVALAASILVGAFGDSFAVLLVGRLIYGVGAGSVMSAGAPWLVDLSQDAPAAGPRRATIALSSGFGLGPLVSGIVGQYAPWPTVTPYVGHVVLLCAMLAIVRRAPDSGGGAPAGPLLRINLDRAGWRSFRRSVAPMAPFVFTFPAISLAALPSMLAGALGSAPIAYTGLLAILTLGSGVLVQPAIRRFAPATAARVGLAIGASGVLLAGFAVATQRPALLLAVAPILGTAYGTCMTAGLQGVQRIAPPEARGGLTGIYLVLTYIGFASPYLIALAMRAVTPVTALLIIAGLAVAAATLLRPHR